MLQQCFGFPEQLAPAANDTVSVAAPPSLPPLPPRDSRRPRATNPRNVVDRRAPERSRTGRSIVRNDRDVPQHTPEEWHQLGLPFPAPIILSEAALAVEAHLEASALAGAPLLGSQRIADLLGHCRSTVRNAMDRLQRMRRIDIETVGNSRRVLVRKHGAWTAWGDIRLLTPAQVEALAGGYALEDKVITASMDDIRRVIVRVANTGEAMPNNPLLAELAGRGGRSSALRALRRLVRVKALKIETRGSYRRVQIVATGRWTGWGEARPGHAPYLHRERGAQMPGDSVKPRHPESRPLPPAVRNAIRYIDITPIDVSHADTCQWTEGDRRAPLFCGVPCSRNSSYCTEHTAIVYPRRRRSELRPDSHRPHAGTANLARLNGYWSQGLCEVA